MKARDRVLVLVLVFLIVCNMAVIVQAQENKIKNMNFKQANIQDVLRAIAEAVKVNLVTDRSVKGDITIHLRDITFKKALDLITKTHGLAYMWDEDTVVVAAPERIDAIYEEIVVKTVELQGLDLSKIKKIVGGFYPGLNIQVDKLNDQLVLMGEKKVINKARNLINKIKFPVQKAGQEKEMKGEVERQTKIIKVNDIEPASLVKNIKNIYPELRVSNSNNKVIVSGPENMVREALALIKELDVSLAKEDNQKTRYKEIVDIKYGSLKTIKEEITKFKQNLNVKINKLEKKLIIEGKKEDVLDAASLARKWSRDQKEVTEIIKVDFTDVSNVKEIVSKLHSDVNFQLNKPAHKLIVKGKKKEVNRVIALVNRLDVARRQVIIEARVEEINKSSLAELGIDYQGSGNGRIKITTEADMKEEAEAGDEYIFNSLQLEWPDYLDVLETKGKAETLANPHLMTLNGEEGKLLIGNRIPVKMENDDGVTSIKYIEAGINLEFTPWITENDEIRLKVAPSVSSLGDELYEGYPQIQTREVETTLRLKDGETFSIGGLIKEDMSENISQIPFLSQLPILGEFFKHKDNEKRRTELLIFITPKIVKEDRDEILENKKKENKLNKRNKKLSSKPGYNGLTENELQNILNKARKTRKYNEEGNLPEHLNILYEVQEGETLSDIAALYGINKGTIKVMNNIKNKVKKGQILTITIPDSHLYRLKKGDKLDDLADKWGVNINRLVKINNIENSQEPPVNTLIIAPKSLNK